MAKIPFKSMDDYIDAQPESSRLVLERVRDAIKKALPGAEESISYNIPAYKISGRPVIYFAGWKRHYSVYPVTPAILAEFKDELAVYEVEKGTIRFPLAERVPMKLIARIAKVRADEVAAGAKAKAAKAR